MKPTLKTARTLRPYTTRAFGWEITVPAGSIVGNGTAHGPDDRYRFWLDFRAEAARLTGFTDSMLRFDLEHYGLNVPAEFCEPYLTS